MNLLLHFHSLSFQLIDAALNKPFFIFSVYYDQSVARMPNQNDQGQDGTTMIALNATIDILYGLSPSYNPVYSSHKPPSFHNHSVVSRQLHNFS